MLVVEIVFVLVNYNTEDEIIHFIRTLKLDFTYKIICVNNYSTRESLKKIRKLSKNFNFDLLENKNSGYGDGNNIGISYALKNYKFKYLIVSNCDIEVIQFNRKDLVKYDKGIIAPEIKTLDQRVQNPMYFKRHPSLYYIYELSRKLKSLKLLSLGVVFSKIFMMIDKKIKKSNTIYAAHGSFLIFTISTLKKVEPVFDSSMFLFCEEIVLAEKMFHKNEPIYYENNIKIKHFEDASMNEYGSSLKKFNLWLDSYKIFYKKYFLKDDFEN